MMLSLTERKAAEKTEVLASRQDNRRAVPRFYVDEDARILLVNHGSPLPCHVVDLSLNGCRVRTRERFLAGILVRVELSFMVHGLAFRFCGVTQWTDGRNLAGIRFVDVTARRREELAEALAELGAESAAKSVQPVEQSPAPQAHAGSVVAEKPKVVEAPRPAQIQRPAPVNVRPSLPVPQARPVLPKAVEAPVLAKQKTEPPPNASLPPTFAPTLARRERRTQSREEVDTSAVIQLINIAALLNGRILDLSLNGCRIRTEERFPVGIYTRVETEFRLEGLPFRLGGVIQAIHDRERRHVGIRFLDMSTRNREHVEQLMEEIREMREKGIATPASQDRSPGAPAGSRE